MRAPIVIIIMGFLASGIAGADGKKIQCWTDDKGHRACGDYVPPQFAQKEVQILNKQGLVIDKKEREKTPEEAADAERSAQEAVEAQKLARSRAAYDRFLLDTYSSTKELERARDIRVQTLDSRIALADKAVIDNQNTLADLRSRAPMKPPAGADPKRVAAINKNNDSLVRQIETFQKSLDTNTLAITTMKKEREQTLAHFAEDIQRWQELKAPNALVKP